jgi:hypothetical protein
MKLELVRRFGGIRVGNDRSPHAVNELPTPRVRVEAPKLLGHLGRGL